MVDAHVWEILELPLLVASKVVTSMLNLPFRNTSSLFAAAEEFAHLIDDDAATSYNMTGSQAYANQDNAGQIHGYQGCHGTGEKTQRILQKQFKCFYRGNLPPSQENFRILKKLKDVREFFFGGGGGCSCSLWTFESNF